ncbi:MAG: PAS domain S-box protein [Verrucomicrobiota bacterium]
MSNKDAEKAGELRRQAEAIVAKIAQAKSASPEERAGLSPEDQSKTLHELLVHQVELGMQNEELLRTQAELDASRALYFDLYDLAPVGYVTVGEPGLILQANLTAANMLGLSRSELVGATLSRVILSEDQDIFYLMRKELLRSGTPQSCELRLVESGGAPIWARLESSLARSDGHPPVCRVSIIDISESKRKDDELRRSEQKFRTVADFTYDWEYWVGKDGLIIYISPSCERVSGYTREAFLSDRRLLSKIVHPDDAEKFAAHVEEVRLLDRLAVAGQAGLQEKCGVDFRIIRKDGAVVYIEHVCQPVFDESGGCLGRRVSNRDITERRLAESSLKESEERLRVILESTADGVLAVGTHGRIMQANRRFGELWQVPPALMESGGDDNDLLNHVTGQLADPEAFLSKVHSLYDSNDTATDTLTCKDGRIYERCSLPMVVEGARIGRVWSFRDITEQSKAREELLKKNAELQRFTNTVSHDLKSPLVTIKTFLGYLEKDLDDAAAVAKDLGYIRGAADKMERLLDELLALARIGHMRNAPVTVPMQEVAGEALELVAGQIAERGVHVEVTREPVWLHGDRVRLVEVFQNLLDNAVKFLGGQPDPRIEIGAEAEGGEIVLFVRDNGKGIDLRHKSKLFGLFEKLDPQTPGSGIGLAMVRRIVEVHGGKIEAQSEGLGRGATIRFTLAGTELRKQTL